MALSCQNRYEQAVEAYKKALELDPEQESYKNNLKIAEDKLKEMQESFRQGQGPGVSSAFFVCFIKKADMQPAEGIVYTVLFLFRHGFDRSGT